MLARQGRHLQPVVSALSFSYVYGVESKGGAEVLSQPAISLRAPGSGISKMSHLAALPTQKGRRFCNYSNSCPVNIHTENSRSA